MKMPVILQYNKRDLPDLLTIEQLQEDLNWGKWSYLEAVAVDGTGVFATLKQITKMVLERASSGDGQHEPIPVGATVGAAEERNTFETAHAGRNEDDDLAARLAPAEEEHEGPVERSALAEGGQGVKPEPIAVRAETATLQAIVSQAPEKSVTATRPHRDDKVSALPGMAPETDSDEDTGSEPPLPEDLSAAKTSEPKPTEGEKPATPAAARSQQQTTAVPEVLETKQSGDGPSDVESVSERPQMSSSDFADTFQIPQVVGMQKSLRVKKKSKRNSSLFGWLKRLFGLGRD
jgi:hypothetical protein